MEKARRWRTRHGGTLFTMLPYAVAARDGPRRGPPWMGCSVGRARELAAGLDRLAGVRVLLRPPQTNAFRVFVDIPAEQFDEATLLMMEKDLICPAFWWDQADVPGWAMTEINVGDATLGWLVEEQVVVLGALFDSARTAVPVDIRS